MKILTERAFREEKTHDTLVIYGSGYSINALNPEQIMRLSSFNSISFNWFCKSKIPVTFYLVREQANTVKRVSKDETKKIFLKALNAPPYLEACKIVQNVHMEKWSEKTRAKVLSYHQCLDKIRGSGIVLKESRESPRNFLKFDIFEDGVIHGQTTLCNVLHIASWLEYKRIIFVGIDLYDSRYFWLGDQEKRAITRAPVNRQHKVAGHVRSLVRLFRKLHPEVGILVANKKSLIAKLGDGIWE